MSVIFPLCAIDFEPRHLGLLTVSDLSLIHISQGIVR